MFKYFELDEFTCSETGNNEMQEGFIHLLDSLRESCDFLLRLHQAIGTELTLLRLIKPQ